MISEETENANVKSSEKNKKCKDELKIKTEVITDPKLPDNKVVRILFFIFEN